MWGCGDKVTIKYQRNNHGPGGFVRLSIVPINQIMNKQAHESLAFHYSCWGGAPTPAKPEEQGRDRAGFSLIGNDGRFHNLTVSYYTVNITIPAVIPDGRYVLGWVWYVEIGGTIFQNTPQKPFSNGFFSDVWSCSFIQILGGKHLQASYKPIFQNNLNNFWGNSCWSANDSPGICRYGL